jgi:hypothetical protein
MRGWRNKGDRIGTSVEHKVVLVHSLRTRVDCFHQSLADTHSLPQAEKTAAAVAAVFLGNACEWQCVDGVVDDGEGGRALALPLAVRSLGDAKRLAG